MNKDAKLEEIRNSKDFQNLMKLQQKFWNKFWKLSNKNLKSKITPEILKYKNISDDYLNQALNLLKT